MKVVYFKSGPEFRRWLKSNHAAASEVWVGFYKKDSGQTGITYPEAVDEALCFGWIDGIRKRVDKFSYTNRFTPRKAKSTWSLINTRRVQELRASGRMAEPGLKAFAARDPRRTGIYSFERKMALDKNAETKFKTSKAAWKFFQAQPPGYRRLFTHWIMSAKREETRASRLERMIDVSAKQLRLDMLTGKPKEWL